MNGQKLFNSYNRPAIFGCPGFLDDEESTAGPGSNTGNNTGNNTEEEEEEERILEGAWQRGEISIPTGDGGGNGQSGSTSASRSEVEKQNEQIRMLQSGGSNTQSSAPGTGQQPRATSSEESENPVSPSESVIARKRVQKRKKRKSRKHRRPPVALAE